MSMRLSDLFGMEIYTTTGEHRGKVYDLIINLEKGRIETITTEPLKVHSKQEARKIINEKSVSYRKVKSAKDILVVDPDMNRLYPDEMEPQESAAPQYQSKYRIHRPRHR